MLFAILVKEARFGLIFDLVCFYLLLFVLIGYLITNIPCYTPDMITNFNAKQALILAKKTLNIEAQALLELERRFDDVAFSESFTQAVDYLLTCQGRVVVSGVGKSGHIARKLAATFASTGTPAFFVHPTEASHGDLGMVTSFDVLVALSNSGETAELLAIVPIIKRTGAKLIALTGRPESRLAQLADIHLDVGVPTEACPLNLAPTASTTAALAMGDALAIAVLDARGFGAEDFARSHPGGALGRKLLTHVSDVMRQGQEVPCVASNVNVMQAIFEMTAKRMGMTIVLDAKGIAQGIFTDGDLRRLLERGENLSTVKVADVMTLHPRAIQANRLAVEAVELMQRYRISQLLVVDEHEHLVGALNMHDLLVAQVV